MDLEELDDNELAALVALLRTVALSNGHVSPEEAESLQVVIDAVGEDAYRRVLPLVEGPLTDDQTLRDFLTRVKTQDARDLIFGTVLEASMADTIETHEVPLMAWLAKAWNVEVRVEDSGA